MSIQFTVSANNQFTTPITVFLQKQSMLLRAPELAEEYGDKSLEIQLNKFLPQNLTGQVLFKFNGKKCSKV